MLDPSRLPEEVRPQVARALRDGLGCEEAIEAIERYLDGGGPRTLPVLLSLATLTYQDAATLVLSRLTQASEAALALVDEALEGQDEADSELLALREQFAGALERERARERRLRELCGDRGRARPTDLMQLAHRILLSGEDDRLAVGLTAEASKS